MARADPKNPLGWYLVQVVEYIVIIAVLGRVVPDSTPGWLLVAIFIAVVAGVFLLNYFVVMPRIGRSSRSDGDGSAE